MTAHQLSVQLESLKDIQGFDLEGFCKDLQYIIDQNKFFYKNVVPKQTGNPSTSFYVPKNAPAEHQVGYFNLTRGFPKELHGGHWCYIIKKFKTKYLIVPLTSVKDRSCPNPMFEKDIHIIGFENNGVSRMQFSDIRTIDSQRLYVNKGCYNVYEEREEIMGTISKIIY